MALSPERPQLQRSHAHIPGLSCKIRARLIPEIEKAVKGPFYFRCIDAWADNQWEAVFAQPVPSPQSARKKQLGMAQPGGLNGDTDEPAWTVLRIDDWLFHHTYKPALSSSSKTDEKLSLIPRTHILN